MTTTFSLDDDIIDVRDIIARVEELEEAQEAGELTDLEGILDALKGYGGDEQWRGDWYPVTLIHHAHFVVYARELLEDCGTIPKDLPHWVHIDWEATASEMLADYSEVSIKGRTYFYR